MLTFSRCAAIVMVFAIASYGCGASGNVPPDSQSSPDARPSPDACVGLVCSVVACEGGAHTTLTGTVFAPNGTLPLYNVAVYVPNAPLEPLTGGATCDRCGQPPSGHPIVLTTTDAHGNFRLEDVPATSEVPLVIQIGKWRRQIQLATVPPCVETAVPISETRLPKNQQEGDIPQMAVSTGGADAFECLLRKVGIDDSEFTTAAGSGRVHMYAGTDGTEQFSPQLNSGATFARSDTLWDTAAHLAPYDVTFLSCEGYEWRNDLALVKPLTTRQAVSDYTDQGGRVFMSHLQNSFIEMAPEATLWRTVITADHIPLDMTDHDVTVDVNTDTAKGEAFADWLVNVGASQTRGSLEVTDARYTVSAVNESIAEKWIYKDQTSHGVPSVQYYQFTTPLTSGTEERCGKVAFADIHVSAGDDSETGILFPEGCTTTTLTPQEKVLAFMVFDIASCVEQPIGRNTGGATTADVSPAPIAPARQ